MAIGDKRTDETTLWRGRRGRQRLECRECEVICERVVYPWHCLRSGCDCVYSYEDQDTMYFGCLHKVFAPELDLAAFSEDRGSAAVEGPALGMTRKHVLSARTSRRGRTKSMDPYGPIRVVRTPRHQCLVRVEQAYDPVSSHNCSNPTFFHHPSAAAEDAMRLSAKGAEGTALEGDGDSSTRT